MNALPHLQPSQITHLLPKKNKNDNILSWIKFTRFDTHSEIVHPSSSVTWGVGKVNTCRHAPSRTPNTRTHTGKKSEPTALLWTASQVWDKVHSPPLGYQTVAKACIHLWKTWRLFSHTAQLSLYLQMVLLSRNVTFDLGSHMERAYQWKVGEDLSCLPNWTNEHMVVCADQIGLTQFKNLDKCPV